MQSRALQDVSDAESKAMKARIDAQIAQKKEERGDTIRDHVVSLMTDGLTNLQNKLQENYEKWEHEFEASSMSQLTVMRDTNMTTAQMASTMNNLLNTFGTSMKNMNLQVNTVNAATKDAVYAVDGKLRAFTGNDTAYGIVLKSNTDMQNRLVASLSGPISDTMANKLANIWRTVTSAGDVTTKATLDTTATMIDTHLKRLEEIESHLPTELTDPLNSIDDTLKKAVQDPTGSQQQIYNAINMVSTTVNASGASIMGVIGKVGGKIVEAIQKTYNNDKQTAEEKKSQSGSDAAVDNVINLINAIGNITPDQATLDRINAASSAHAALTEQQKNLVTNGQILFDAMALWNSDDMQRRFQEWVENEINAKEFDNILRGKATGSRSINKNDRYLTQELGGEIITTKDGVLIPLEAGDGVIPAQLTKNLFEMARNYPNLPGTEMVQIPNLPNSGMKQNITVTYGSLLTVNGNVDKQALPGLKQILQESYEYTQKRLAQDARMGGMRRRY